jgi:CubicO group peptidase (beta-lactamase class C family)
MYAALLGDVDGVRLITAQRLREATALSMTGPDQVFLMPTTWALGFGLGRLGSTPQDSPTVFGIGGFGGSFACGDTATGISFAATKNRITQDFSAATELGNIVTAALTA